LNELDIKLNKHNDYSLQMVEKLLSNTILNELWKKVLKMADNFNCAQGVNYKSLALRKELECLQI